MQTIHLTAAHDPDSPLPELIDEIRAVEKVLRPLSERGLWDVYTNRAANLQDVFDTFSRHGASIRVFHYAGHADQEELALEGGGHVRGIAGLFGLAEPDEKGVNPLYLVFLNGCASQGQVEQLHAAGVGAVIATSREIGDAVARNFAERFYQTWAIEGKTLKQAFQTAKAYVESDSSQQHKSIEIREMRGVRLSAGEEEDFPWGLYPNPALEDRILDWQLNQPPQLSPQILSRVRSTASEGLLELVYEFEQSDAEAQEEIQTGKDPLLVLITRLPWTVGTHLRRLFALEDSQSMAVPGQERLRELVSAYAELTRFISYIALSLLWDDCQHADLKPERLRELPLVPDASEGKTTDFVWRLRQYLALQGEISDRSDAIKQYLQEFLEETNRGLAEGYLFLEELKAALADEATQRLGELILARTGKADGMGELCLQTEAIFTSFLRAALWLTRYRLYTVRSILVDKIRFLPLRAPYVHKIMSLHGAFSDIKLLSTKREIASDNFCILLAPSHPPDGDLLSSAINLSPFYIDKSAYLEDKTAHYPAIYVLKYYGDNEEFIYEYLDGDVNHQYLFEEDHRLVIRRVGAIFPPALKVDLRDSQNFRIIHQQLLKLKSDFAAA